MIHKLVEAQFSIWSFLFDLKTAIHGAMYLPRHFTGEDREAFRLMEEYPLATLIGMGDGQPVVNHFPMIAKGEPVKLIGHMARRNPHCKQLAEGARVTAIFHGPNAYITPQWYAGYDVPTWNYAVAHIHGKIHWIEAYEPLVEILRDLTGKFESQLPTPWSFGLPDDLAEPRILTGAIIGFEIEILEVETKLKLGQNRSQEDRRGAIQGLSGRPDEMSRKIGEMMVATEIIK